MASPCLRSFVVYTVAILSMPHVTPGNYSNETQNLSSLVTALNSIPLIGGVYETT
nr:MAG TPA: CAAD domains of cyanobacterial aminoacyl-tRNA synthetase [Bacteriophage sp.]